ncbi:MAG TPA: helix-turn-helix transcriptional regulator [Thermoanaerobaculia bacterium]|jgi:transcriptional regulator with XRE-family HTH domain|nr:helix-turn-helix transcriptional regulator [Thermoanaerobaculia bacterium]
MFGNLGQTLALLRELRGRSQAQVAREAGIGKSQLSKYESGKELPKLDSLGKVLTALDLGPVDLFSTLEMVDRRAASLTGKPEDPLAWLHGGAELHSDLLSEAASQAFNEVMAGVLALHRTVLGEIVFRPAGTKRRKPCSTLT